ncbi:MAG TPA: Mpo1-like protein, partial [Terriglobales bacterium]|nr:Mpo1-like protein [Terriglobales bacterium]
LIVVWWHWKIALALIPSAFALAWLGHLIEGNKPAFLSNPTHVLVAPVWLVRKLTGRERSTRAAGQQ